MGSLWVFLVVAVLLSVTPGPDDVLVVSSCLRGGTRAGAATAAGVATGSLAWGAAAAVGLAAAVTRSSALYGSVRITGAGYLIALGVLPLIGSVLRRAPANARPGPISPAPPGPRSGAGWAFTSGLLSDLLNPKIGVFYLAVVPQFVPAGAPPLPYSLLLCGIDVAVAVVWLLALTWTVHRAVTWFHRPSVTRWSQRLFSATLICVGATAAVGF
jgi:threonine/homoserine/homoserine lactone efflux protein